MVDNARRSDFTKDGPRSLARGAQCNWHARADAVARRVLTFATSLLDLPQVQPRRYICVTHSPVSLWSRAS